MAQVVVVTSGKGGVGKSTLTMGLGKALAEMGQRVVLVELDSGLRCLDILMDVPDEVVYDLSDVLCDRSTLEQALVPISPQISLLAAAYAPDFLPTKTEMELLNKALQNHFDWVLMDMGAGMGTRFSHLESITDVALLVVTPDPICVRDCRRTSDMLWENGVQNVRLVIHKVDLEWKNAIQNFDSIIDQTATQLLAVIPKCDELVVGKIPYKDGLWQKTINNLAKRLNNENIELEIQ